jgi:hypothetical protein
MMKAKRKANPSGVRIVHNKLLGGWYVVRGPHQTPLNGRFNSKEEAQAWLLRKKNPGKKRAVTNRWGVTVHVGDSFKVRHVRGEVEGPFIVSKLETSGEYAKAYGPRVVFEHGGSASIDDLIVIPHSYKKNPSGEVFCYHCKKHITGKVLRIVPSNLHGQLLGDFGKSFHPACYKKAQEYLRKKNPARKKSRSLSVPETHQLKIARDTLKMHPAAVGVMGGPSHAEARAIIARLTGKRK